MSITKQISQALSFPRFEIFPGKVWRMETFFPDKIYPAFGVTGMIELTKYVWIHIFYQIKTMVGKLVIAFRTLLFNFVFQMFRSTLDKTSRQTSSRIILPSIGFIKQRKTHTKIPATGFFFD